MIILCPENVEQVAKSPHPAKGKMDPLTMATWLLEEQGKKDYGSIRHGMEVIINMDFPSVNDSSPPLLVV